jgi:hypothetical protein
VLKACNVEPELLLVVLVSIDLLDPESVKLA